MPARLERSMTYIFCNQILCPWGAKAGLVIFLHGSCKNGSRRPHRSCSQLCLIREYRKVGLTMVAYVQFDIRHVVRDRPCASYLM